MNIIEEKLYYRVQTLYVSLQKKLIRKKLEIAGDHPIRIDLLRTLQSIRGSISACDAFIDIGANQGEFSRVFSDVYHPSTLICIEPNEGLNKSIRDNNGNPVPVIINKAVSDSESEMLFYFHSDSQMSSLFPSNKDLIKRDFGEDDADQTVERKVQVTTLDVVFDEHSERLKGKTIFLKIDTQGNELEVLKGGAKALGMVRYCLLEYMFHTPYEKQYPFEAIMTVMTGHGFKLLGPMHSSYRVEGELGAVLFLFGK